MAAYQLCSRAVMADSGRKHSICLAVQIRNCKVAVAMAEVSAFMKLHLSRPAAQSANVRRTMAAVCVRKTLQPSPSPAAQSADVAPLWVMAAAQAWTIQPSPSATAPSAAAQSADVRQVRAAVCMQQILQKSPSAAAQSADGGELGCGLYATNSSEITISGGTISGCTGVTGRRFVRGQFNRHHHRRYNQRM